MAADVGVEQEHEPKGLGGWLVLVGARVVISPIRLSVEGYQYFAPLSEEGAWESLSEEAGNHPVLQPLIGGELFFNLLLIVASVYLAYLFFTKHPWFPRLFIAILLVDLGFTTLDGWLASIAAYWDGIAEDTLKGIAGALVACIVFIPYMLASKRVASTFVDEATER